MSTARIPDDPSNATAITLKPNSEESQERDVLLKGLDFEISQRSSDAAHQGISYWGLIVSAVFIFWTGFDLAFREAHSWAEVVLVFLATHTIILQARHSLGEFIPRNSTKSDAPTIVRRATFISSLILNGNQFINIAYIFFETAILLTASLFLFLSGYKWVGATLFGLNFVMLLFGFTFLLLSRISLPLFDTLTKQNQKHNFLQKGIISHLFRAAIVFIPIPAICKATPPISSSDWKLGLLLAALLTLLGWISTRSRQSPLLEPLLRIRTDLAFGWTTPEVAKANIEDLLLGIPPDRVLATDVHKISGIYNHIRQRSDQVLCEMEALIELKKIFDTQTDQQSFKLIHQDTILYSGRFTFEVSKRIIAMWQTSKIEERTIKARIDLGKKLLSFSGVDIKKNMREAAESKAKADGSWQKHNILLPTYWAAYNAMVIPKSTPAASGVPMREIFRTIKQMVRNE